MKQPSTRLLAVALASALSVAMPLAADAAGASDNKVRIGLLLDMAGPYSDISGQGSATAARMAVEDFGGKVLGAPIDVLVQDIQNKADTASNKAREWFDTEQVDMIADVTGAAPALAVLDIAKQKNRIVFFNSANPSRLSNEDCSAVSVHYVPDSFAIANAAGASIVKQGGDTWFFITADNAFGQSVEKDVSAVVVANGGKVIGSARHPLNASDFSSFILRAQSSGAKVVAFANGGSDFVNAMKSAREFKLGDKQTLAGLVVFVNDFHGLGLKATGGMLAAEGFYWDLNDETRKFSRRYFERMKKMPNRLQAGVYSSVTTYLKAVQAAGTDDTAAVMAKIKSLPINDFYAKGGYVRADGRAIYDVNLMQVKTPEESKYPWDYYKVKTVVPGAQAFLPLDKSSCPLVKK
ncbi:MAG: ABC transporter substrate-binding protein [Comamonadaceae bacterium]|nr:MAG: ABC transporter substrate-binding protein [Comamonadaceae bacterium]